MSGEPVERADSSPLDGVTAAFADWRQGDVVSSDALLFMWVADRNQPLTSAATESAAADGGEEHDVLVTVRHEAIVVLTQTCDLVRSCSQRPFVQLAPLVRLPLVDARGARRGHIPRYAHIPQSGEDAFADLDLVMTVEKARIADIPRQPGMADDAERRTFARAVARKFERFAFPDAFSVSLGPFTERVRRRHDRPESAEGAAFQQVRQVRAETPDWEVDNVDVNLIFILAPGELADQARPSDQDERWHDRHNRQPPPAEIAARLNQCAPGTPEARWLWELLTDAWVDSCRVQPPVASLTAEVIPADEMTVQRYWSSVELDLDYLSNPAPLPLR